MESLILLLMVFYKNMKNILPFHIPVCELFLSFLLVLKMGFYNLK